MASGPPLTSPEFYGLGEDDVLQRIENGETLTSIAGSVGKNKSMLTRWINAEEQRSARVREARVAAASSWDECAESEIRAASDAFELAKAKEIAHHLRWRASKIAPMYSDKVQADIKAEITDKVDKEDLARRVIFMLAERATKGQT